MVTVHMSSLSLIPWYLGFATIDSKKKYSLSAVTAYVIHLSDTFTNPALSLEDTLLLTKLEQFKLETLCTRWSSSEGCFYQKMTFYFNIFFFFFVNTVTDITFSYLLQYF